ncbi:MAG: M24 family metallopeptidase [Minisyncoccia bacterium]|jgi:Xaa-Pro aminopeptidase
MFKIPYEEYKFRINNIYNLMEKYQLDGIYISNPVNIKYFLGVHYLQTERPLAIIFHKNGNVYFFGPIIEKEHFKSQCNFISEFFTYLDYPGEVHPFKKFVEWFNELNFLDKNIGVDNINFYSNYWGFKGINISELFKFNKIYNIFDELYDLRKIKSSNEIELIKESIKWGNLAHRLLQDYTEEGLFDWVISAKASLEASIVMKKTLGRDYIPTTTGIFPVSAGFRGQVGEHSAFPHSVSIERPLKIGDILGTGANADIDGYHSELERNLFLGKPNEKFEKYHKIAIKMQKAAMEKLKPLNKFSDADKAALKIAKDEGVLDFVLHHSGHNIGLEAHEAPFLDIGDQTEIKPGMVLTVEPGIYIPGVGGFRHSDTVLITEEGAKMLTYYPSEIEYLTII